MSARLTAALLAGRAAASLSRRLRLGGGTVISGHLVPRIAPDVLPRVVARLPRGAVLVSGTNGKTTSTRLISHILRRAGLIPLHNRSGANLLPGLVSAVVAGSDLRGVPRAHVGVFEVDEATLPSALAQVRPRALLLTNLFRDQLDRYGEVELVARLWRGALATLPASATALLNADDPLVAALGWSLPPDRVLYFGVDEGPAADSTLPHSADARLCPACGAGLAYDRVWYGHLGHYHCPGCGRARPAPAVALRQFAAHGTSGSTLRLVTPAGGLTATLGLPGLYNAYNALAAVAVCLALGLTPAQIEQGLAGFSAAFGRLERVQWGDRTLLLALVKNPTGCTEVLRTLLQEEVARTWVIIINDQFADGTDVSWLWDAEFEWLAGRVERVVCSGLRALDMAVRCKYAGIAEERIEIEPDVATALARGAALTPPGEVCYVLPTYTAMLQAREALVRLGHAGAFWEE